MGVEGGLWQQHRGEDCMGCLNLLLIEGGWLVD